MKWTKKLLIKYLCETGWLDPRYPTPKGVEEILPELVKRLNSSDKTRNDANLVANDLHGGVSPSGQDDGRGSIADGQPSRRE